MSDVLALSLLYGALGLLPGVIAALLFRKWWMVPLLACALGIGAFYVFSVIYLFTQIHILNQ